MFQPERINANATTAMCKVRAYPDELGIIREAVVLSGKLDYQNRQRLPRDEEQSTFDAEPFTATSLGAGVGNEWWCDLQVGGQYGLKYPCVAIE